MTTIHLTDVYGIEHRIDAAPEGKLMEVLRNYDFGVAAACGGYCSCATCHVFIGAEWRSLLPDKQSDEDELLSILSTYHPESSRLSCQIPFTAAMDGIRVTVAPEE